MRIVAKFCVMAEGEGATTIDYPIAKPTILSAAAPLVPPYVPQPLGSGIFWALIKQKS